LSDACGGAFVGAPQDNCVEIAYFMLKEKEGRGYATNTVAGLIDIARRAEPGVDDAGTVWEWDREAP
jgi:hypothetical protein